MFTGGWRLFSDVEGVICRDALPVSCPLPVLVQISFGLFMIGWVPSSCVGCDGVRFLAFVFDMFFLLPGVCSLASRREVCVRFYIFRPGRPLSVFRCSNVVIECFLLHPRHSCQRQFLLRFRRPRLLPRVPFSVKAISRSSGFPQFR